MKSQTIEAKIFVLSAQEIESSRLLLNSKNKHFAEGSANSSGELWENLILYCEKGKECILFIAFEEPLDAFEVMEAVK